MAGAMWEAELGWMGRIDLQAQILCIESVLPPGGR